MTHETVKSSTAGRAGVTRHRKISRPVAYRGARRPPRSWLELTINTVLGVGVALAVVELAAVALAISGGW